MNHNGGLWADTVAQVFRGRELANLHNYGPLLMWVSFDGGRMTEGAWSAVQRREWVGLLSSAAGNQSFKKYLGEAASKELEKPLADAMNFFGRSLRPNSEEDASLIGLKETAPLINAGRTLGQGPLAPVATLTARDLLNYGWEMTGLQLGTRYRFVEYAWGVHDLARRIRSSAAAEIQGILPFFVNEDAAKSATYRQSLARLQLVDRLYLRAGWSENPFTEKNRSNAKTFVNRTWLRPREMEWQVRSLWNEDNLTPIIELFDYYEANGGPLAASFALNYLGDIKSEGFKHLTNGPAFVKKFTAKLPYISAEYMPALYSQIMRGKDPFERAQLMEKMYWEHPESAYENRIFRNYVIAGAFKSAQRFYGQARRFIQQRSTVEVSNGLGRSAYITGYLLGDAELRQAALQDSASGSQSDMEMRIYEAVAFDDLRTLRREVADLIDRYGQNKSPGHPDKMLEAFMPHMEALKDRKHARHAAALKFFAGSDAWPIFRWICIEKFGLPKEEAIQFLGGKESALLQRGLVAYLEKDHAGMLEYVNQYNARGVIDDRVILLQTLFDRLEGNKFTREEPDLKPQKVVTLRDIVEDALAAQQLSKP